MKGIIIKSVFALGLGIAPCVALAQAQTEGQSGATTGGQACPPGAECPSGGQQMEGQAGATTEGQADTEVMPPEGQAGATTETETEGQAGTTPTEEPTEGQAEAPAEEPTEGQAEAPAEEPTEGQAEAPAEEPTEGQAEAPAEEPTEGQAQTDQPADQDQTETGAVPPAEVTVEQKTEIKQVVQEVDVDPIPVDRIDFDIDVGVAVPRTIEVRPLPPQIVRIVPEYEDYLYFVLADGRIVIVEPDTLEIVVIIV
jgi:hypothetical protein